MSHPLRCVGAHLFLKFYFSHDSALFNRSDYVKKLESYITCEHQSPFLSIDCAVCKAQTRAKHSNSYSVLSYHTPAADSKVETFCELECQVCRTKFKLYGHKTNVLFAPDIFRDESK